MTIACSDGKIFLYARSPVAPLLVDEVSEERKASENEEIHQGRQSGARKQHCFGPISCQAQVALLAPRLQVPN